MADALPTTLDDLTREELLAVARRAGLAMRVRRADLLSARHESLSAEALRCERAAQDAWAAWMDAVEQRSLAFDAAQAAFHAPPAKWRSAERAYIAAQDEVLRLEASRIYAERKAKRARAAEQTAWAAWEKEAGL
ncbi:MULTISPECIES: hypothetical protein [unclassified Xanthobacter]|uniref:hypothetical protein n=1 Tax=unclassified Xanthobacter TaxID=2623496 RepID=UPI001EDD079D|nr:MULTISPECIES: hypothetical protein [unclassified Xanthobacter]